MTEFGKYFLPGPTEVAPEILEAMNRPIIGHRSAAITQLIGDMQPGLSRMFMTERPVFISTSSSTGMMEAAITNLTAKRVLCLTCGAFSDRFAAIAEATGRDADRLAVDWGQPNRAHQVREALEKGAGAYDLVTLVHSESSTGVLNPLREISDAVHEFPGVLLAVDTVSSMAAAPVLMDEWNLDFVLTGSQKAVALPPGLALAAASEAAMARAEEVEHRGFYFDLLKFQKRLDMAFQTPNTPAVSLIYALEAQLSRMHAEGMERRWARHWEMATRTFEWVDRTAERTGAAFSLFAPEGYRSPGVTSIQLPEGIEGPHVVAGLAERGFTIATGYGKLKQPTIRIGHMGDHTLEELEAVLGALDEVVDSLVERVPVGG